MNKKGMEAVTLLIVMIIGLAVAVVAIVLIMKGRALGSQAGDLSPGQDARCLQKTELMGKTGQSGSVVDKDGDDRDDSCDWCICGTNTNRCSNKPKDRGGADNDGDFLPEICDKDDSLGKGRTVVEFNEANCKAGTTLYEISSGKQCFIQ